MLDMKLDDPDEADYNAWRVMFIPQYPHTSIPLILNMGLIQQTGTDPAKICAELPRESTNTESKFIKRVHHVTEYVGHIRCCTNWFHYSRLPLVHAIGQGNLQWVRQLLKQTDVGLDCRNLQGWNALQQACSIEPYSAAWKQQKQIAQLLISNGTDVNAPPGEGYGSTALQAACKPGNEEIVNILLEHGADINGPGGPIGGMSALAEASWTGHFDLVKKLLDLGADINQPVSKQLGHNALSAAAHNGYLEILNYLIRKGFNLRGRGGLLALDIAIRRNQEEVVSRLLELGIDVNGEMDGITPFHSVKTLDMLRILIAHGADLNAPCSEPGELPALQSAAQCGSIELVAELLRLKANMTYQGPNIRGRTALQYAAARQFNSVPVMELFIEHGADVNEPRWAEEGYTSLEAACHAVVKNKLELGIEPVKFLLERGARITTFTLHVAAAWNHEAFIRLLLHNGALTEDLHQPTNIPIV